MDNITQTDPAEKIAVIDNRHKILSITTKMNAHQKGLLHATVIGEVINSKGLRLMVKQSASRQDAGQYVSPIGGHVKAEETYEAAIKREAHEELGISNFRLVKKGELIFNRPVRGHIENHYFIVFELFTDERIHLNHESESCRWFTTGKLKSELKNKPGIFGGAFIPVVNKLYPELLS